MAAAPDAMGVGVLGAWYTPQPQEKAPAQGWGFLYPLVCPLVYSDTLPAESFCFTFFNGRYVLTTRHFFQADRLASYFERNEP